jgi:hypothetical protein
MRLDTGRDRLIIGVDRLQDAPVVAEMQPVVLAALRQRWQTLGGAVGGAELGLEHPGYAIVFAVAQALRGWAHEHRVDLQAASFLLTSQQVEDARVADKYDRAEAIELRDQLRQWGMCRENLDGFGAPPAPLT